MSTYFIDCEASSLDKGSYPTEVGWCSHDLLSGGSHLIRPTAEWLAEPWSAESEKVTGISQVMLGCHGLPPEQVASVLNKALVGADLLSDAPAWDGYWLDMLFSATGVEKGIKALSDVDVMTGTRAAKLLMPADEFDRLASAMKRAAGLVPHHALDDAVGMALDLAAVSSYEIELDHGEEQAEAFRTEMVARARTLVFAYGRPRRESAETEVRRIAASHGLASDGPVSEVVLRLMQDEVITPEQATDLLLRHDEEGWKC